MQKAFRVIKEYRSTCPIPLTGQKGDRLGAERRESEWKGWLWCTTSSGKSGWVPESWLELKGDTGVLRRDYSAAELTVTPGEILAASLFESEWAWATKESEERGWVPLAHLAPIAGPQPPYPLSDTDQINLLRKLMLHWDGQWFLKTTERFGLEEATELNARVRASFGRIEMRLLLKAVGKSRADDLPDALRLLETYAGAFMGPGLRAEFIALDSQRAEIFVDRCAAYEGARQAALPREDQACVACETLWNAWLEILLPGVGVEIEILQRQGKGDSVCQFLIRADGEEAHVGPGAVPEW